MNRFKSPLTVLYIEYDILTIDQVAMLLDLILILEVYMEKVYIDINELLEFNNKSFKDFGDKEFLRCRCPNCPSVKAPALSIHKSLNFGVCFRCGILYLNKGIHKSKLNDGLSNLIINSPISFTGITRVPDKLIMELYDRVPPEGNEYLRGRNPFVRDWTVYDLRYAENEIFIPYYYMDRFIFYQIRYMSGDRRYNMPSLPSPIYIPGGEWDISKDTLICEGPFDAMALHCSVGDLFNIVALVGKEVTKYKSQLLSYLSTGGYHIMLDEEILSKKIQKSLPGSTVIHTDGPDPEELLDQLGLEEFRKYVLSEVNKNGGLI